MGFCLEVMRKLDDLLRGVLSPEETRLVRQHVEACGNCRIVLRSAERTLQTYFATPERKKTAA